MKVCFKQRKFMTLLEKIKSTQLQARKDRDTVTASLLTTLIGDAVMVGKNNGNRESTDVEVIATIKKFINNINETLKALEAKRPTFVGTGVYVDVATVKANEEKRILESFLPKQLIGDELDAVINSVITAVGAASPADLGKVMKELKTSHEGTYDGALASKLIRHKLAVLDLI